MLCWFCTRKDSFKLRISAVNATKSEGVDLATITEETLNAKLYFLCSEFILIYSYFPVITCILKTTIRSSSAKLYIEVSGFILDLPLKLTVIYNINLENDH